MVYYRNSLLLYQIFDDLAKRLIEEQLYLSVTSFHPASICPKVSFAEMDGQNFIMYAHVGFWEEIVRDKMPHSKFFLQSDLDAVGELTRYSGLPSFISDITLQMPRFHHSNRIAVPFSDPEGFATYYLVCMKENYKNWKVLF